MSTKAHTMKQDLSPVNSRSSRATVGVVCTCSTRRSAQTTDLTSESAACMAAAFDQTFLSLSLFRSLTVICRRRQPQMNGT